MFLLSHVFTKLLDACVWNARFEQRGVSQRWSISQINDSTHYARKVQAAFNVRFFICLLSEWHITGWSSKWKTIIRTSVFRAIGIRCGMLQFCISGILSNERSLWNVEHAKILMYSRFTVSGKACCTRPMWIPCMSFNLAGLEVSLVLKQICDTTLLFKRSILNFSRLDCWLSTIHAYISLNPHFNYCTLVIDGTGFFCFDTQVNDFVEKRVSPSIRWFEITR